MHITVNGKPEALNDPTTVAQLVQHLDLTRKRIAIEVNKELVAKGMWETALLKEGDQVEIVTFVGGG